MKKTDPCIEYNKEKLILKRKFNAKLTELLEWHGKKSLTLSQQFGKRYKKWNALNQ